MWRRSARVVVVLPQAVVEDQPPDHRDHADRGGDPQAHGADRPADLPDRAGYEAEGGRCHAGRERAAQSQHQTPRPVHPDHPGQRPQRSRRPRDPEVEVVVFGFRRPKARRAVLQSAQRPSVGVRPFPSGPLEDDACCDLAGLLGRFERVHRRDDQQRSRLRLTQLGDHRLVVLVYRQVGQREREVPALLRGPLARQVDQPLTTGVAGSSQASR
jgi:hypothetical protein